MIVAHTYYRCDTPSKIALPEGGNGEYRWRRSPLGKSLRGHPCFLHRFACETSFSDQFTGAPFVRLLLQKLPSRTPIRTGKLEFSNCLITNLGLISTNLWQEQARWGSLWATMVIGQRHICNVWLLTPKPEYLTRPSDQSQ